MSTPNDRWQIKPPLDGDYESKAIVSEAGNIIRCDLRGNRLHDSRILESRENVPDPKKTDERKRRMLDAWMSATKIPSHLCGQQMHFVSGIVNGKAAYQDFLVLGKDADPDISILKEAKTVIHVTVREFSTSQADRVSRC